MKGNTAATRKTRPAALEQIEPAERVHRNEDVPESQAEVLRNRSRVTRPAAPSDVLPVDSTRARRRATKGGVFAASFPWEKLRK